MEYTSKICLEKNLFGILENSYKINVNINILYLFFIGL